MVLSVFAWPVRVYYEDTDCGGVVYNANYLKFMERSRTEWLRAKGLEQDALIETHGLIFAVRSASLEFMRGARFNDDLRVTAELVEADRLNLVFEQVVYRHDDMAPDEPLCRGRVRVVAVDAGSLRPRRMAKSLFEEIIA